MKGLELTVDVRCARSRLGDPDVLRRLLLNVVGNAIQNTDSGGVAVQFDDGLDGRLEVRVEDTGRGMDAGEVEELLDLLAAGSGRRRKGESESSIRGGLGLSICRQLCRLVGGRIGIDSEPGQGTCVRLELPFRESRSSSQLMNASV
jgi:signal transduction histidine kinase